MILNVKVLRLYTVEDKNAFQMKLVITIIIIILFQQNVWGQIRTIHVFVALCDNQYQGIVPVPKNLGDGKNPRTNLYWGAAYGVKSYLNYKTNDWELVKKLEPDNPVILERLLFKHFAEEVYILADAYDGEKIKTCVEDFLKASNGQNSIQILHDSTVLEFGGGSNLISYIGHDGLMDFSVDIDYKPHMNEKKDVIILACYSKDYFSAEIEDANANPLLWTTHLMAPEAYTLKGAIDGWIRNESGEEIDERAAQMYNKYQKCGINGARNLFTTGY